ncbi:MAG TPA: UTP--glucose-1-phosphate uridylyltransferase GalU [Methanoculleus thermophilus]|nr:UTP--glucose-1-phosphate uridylyltransferase GalU [Methanoculleus thermophilus]
MAVTKAVIPAAGLGTRFLPVTKSMPKEMLPIIDVPVIHYVVKEAVDSGIDDIIIITGRSKRAIEDYFDDAPELEMHLARNHKQDLLEIVQDISSLVDIHYIRQKEPRGLGDAVLRAEKHIGDEPFAVLLGDDIIRNARPCTKQLIDIYNRYQCSVIAVEEVPHEKVSSYGIIDGGMLEDALYRVDDIIEKPDVDRAPSDLGAIGRYIFTPQIFDCLKKTREGVGNEIQLTDAIRLLKENQNIYGYLFKGKRYDTGDRFGYIEAIIDFALEDARLEPQLSEYLQNLVNVHT